VEAGEDDHQPSCNHQSRPIKIEAYVLARSRVGTANTNNSSTLGNFTVTVTSPPDPSNGNISNITVYSFAGGYQTQEVVHQGSSTGPVLETVTTCYNGNLSSCATPTAVPASPVTETDVYTSFNGGSSNRVRTLFDTYGNVTSTVNYDFGGSTILSQSTTSYGSWNSSSCVSVGSNVNDAPCDTKVLNGAGNTKSETRFTYNSTGHPTSVSRLVSGSTFLSLTAAFNTNGTLAWSKDAAGNQTTFSYNGPQGCNSLLPTSVTAPLSISTSTTWDCNGGVLTSVTDPNSQVTSYSYAANGVADPFWRVLSVTDASSNVTTFAYSPTTVETALSFNNGSSTVDGLTTTDGLGRVKLRQKRQAPSSTSFDTVQYKYDAIGRRTSVSMPCSAAAGAGCSTAVTSTTYDALNRAAQTTDGGGGTVTTAYNIKDMLQSIGPAPPGEHTKGRQYEYDGMGRITSVCEILTSGGASCGQATTASGYKTSYAYTVPAAGGTQMVVTQGTQTRTGLINGG